MLKSIRIASFVEPLNLIIISLSPFIFLSFISWAIDYNFSSSFKTCFLYAYKFYLLSYGHGAIVENEVISITPLLSSAFIVYLVYFQTKRIFLSNAQFTKFAYLVNTIIYFFMSFIYFFWLNLYLLENIAFLNLFLIAFLNSLILSSLILFFEKRFFKHKITACAFYNIASMPFKFVIALYLFLIFISSVIIAFAACFGWIDSLNIYESLGANFSSVLLLGASQLFYLLNIIIFGIFYFIGMGFSVGGNNYDFFAANALHNKPLIPIFNILPKNSSFCLYIFALTIVFVCVIFIKYFDNNLLSFKLIFYNSLLFSLEFVAVLCVAALINQGTVFGAKISAIFINIYIPFVSLFLSALFSLLLKKVYFKVKYRHIA